MEKCLQNSKENALPLGVQHSATAMKPPSVNFLRHVPFIPTSSPNRCKGGSTPAWVTEARELSRQWDPGGERTVAEETGGLCAADRPGGRRLQEGSLPEDTTERISEEFQCTERRFTRPKESPGSNYWVLGRKSGANVCASTHHTNQQFLTSSKISLKRISNHVFYLAHPHTAFK